MDGFKKWVLNYDLITLLLGGLLMYFSESIVTILFPLDPIPSDTISLLYYYLFFSIAAFWIFKGIVYATIKIYWNKLYEYFENGFDLDFDELTVWQKVLISLSFYWLLFLSLVIIFAVSVSIM